MNENYIINRIIKHLGSEFIGDDCAYLQDLGIVVTHDSLVENIHFKREWISPSQLGYKSVTANISDILASGAKPAYLTISLSLPNNINDFFIDEFYNGAKSALCGAKIVGGDITGSKKDIVVSISAIGITNNRNISSRKKAKDGYIVVTHGDFGSSAEGLEALINNDFNNKFIINHLEPKLCPEFSEYIATKINEPYAMMDTSDGLADALYKIADASKVKICIDYNKIPHKIEVSKDKVLFGGEDYNLIAVVPDKYFNYIPNAVIIGSAEKYDGIKVDISGEKFINYNQIKTYNHFGE